MAEGIKGLNDRPMPSSPQKITEAYKEQLLAAVRRRPRSQPGPTVFDSEAVLFREYERRFLVKSTVRYLFLSLFRSFAMLIASIAIIVVGSMTSSSTLAASPSPKSAHAASTSPSPIQRPAYTLSAGNGVATVASPLPTKVFFFSPSGIRGTFNGPADCRMTSLAAPRVNAWRCGIEHVMYDPCFSTSAQANYVICDTNPAGDGRGMKATLAHPLPIPGPYSSGMQAWAMRLSDGSVCTAASGATGLFGGVRLNYNCTSGWWIVGFPRIGSVWTVRLVKEGQSPQTQPVPMSVLEAWW